MIFSKVLHLLDGKLSRLNIWDVLLFSRRTFDATEEIYIPVDKVLILRCPYFDAEVKLDGELYIL